jgi:hypothetical protein
VEGHLGYGSAPLPIKGHFGFEGWVGGALGWTPSSEDISVVPGWTVGVGVPYRVSRSRRPWELDRRALTYWFVQPKVGFVQLVDVPGDWTVDNLFLASLVVGVDSWLLVEP